MPSSRIIDLALGLAFIFGVTAAVSSVLTELIARFLGLRGTYLLRGLRELLDGGGSAATVLSSVEVEYASAVALVRGAAVPATAAAPAPTATGALLGSPILRNQGMSGTVSQRTLEVTSGTSRFGSPAGSTVPSGPGDRLRVQRRSLPAYISSRAFADAVLDLLVPDSAGVTDMRTVSASVDALPDSMATLRSSLRSLVRTAGDDTTRFRESVEHWYDDHMARVSGWYKRRVAKITLLVGALLVLLLNVNALTIGRTLYTDNDVRAAVASVAAQSTQCPVGQDQQTCLKDLQARLATAAGAGLPIGWTTVRDCADPASGCDWLDQRGIFAHSGGSPWQLLLVLVGFLLTITALVPGARFWFDLLGKLGSLRTSGPRPQANGSS